MSTELDKMMIMDHYKFPHNKVDGDLKGYIKLEGYNPSCGDKVNIYIKEENGKLDIKWNGDGCSICCASTSIMTDELHDLTKDEACEKINNYKLLITGHDCDSSKFEEALALSGLEQFPSRFKCGYLAWDTVDQFVSDKN